MKWIQTNLKKEIRYQRIERTLKNKLKKRKEFKDKIKEKEKNNK